MPPTLSNGTRLGPYEILSSIGKGGMGEVYRAWDSRLERVVAIKVLPQSLRRAELQKRFEREARAVAALSHPHICKLFDVGREGETEFLVMEYLEGKTLADRLSRGALPLAEVLRIGIEIAGALDEAHRHGVIHRDVKPGNIMLTKSGAKLLDFGLARFQRSHEEMSKTAPTAVRSESLTPDGTVMGTFQYMSPEQLEGRADARSDIFAFGAILYEMATGLKAFSGSSRAALTAAILTAEPKPVSAITAGFPSAFDAIVRICLMKDPERRWQSVRDIGTQLGVIGTADTDVSTPPSPRRARRWFVLGPALAAVAILITMLIATRVPRPAAESSARFTIPPPEGQSFGTHVERQTFAMSPDGRTLAFVAGGFLWLRPLASLAAERLTGTEGATSPFWSPDSRAVAFFAGGHLKKSDVRAGPPVILCDFVQRSASGTWSDQGILFSAIRDAVIYWIHEPGQPPVPLLKASPSEIRIHWSELLPDSRRFLYLAQERNSGRWTLRAGSLDGGPSTFIMEVASRVQYTRAGYLLYVKEGALLAQRFDLAHLRVEGQPAVIAGHVSSFSSTARAEFSASDTGVLAYQDGQDINHLAWVDRHGHEGQRVGAPGHHWSVRLSPVGNRAVTSIDDPQRGTLDLWIDDLTRGIQTRFTSDPASENNPVWSPDGRQIVYSSDKGGGPPHLFVKASDGSGTERALLPRGDQQEPLDWFPDGKSILYDLIDQHTGSIGMQILSLSSGQRALFGSTRFYEQQGRVSPDGKWIAFASLESGRFEIYLAAFPASGVKFLVSPAGGDGPRWRRDGRELFYVSRDNTMTVVPIRDGNPIGIGTPTALFPINAGWYDYDVSGDGQRFLMILPDSSEGSSPIKIDLDWSRVIDRS